MRLKQVQRFIWAKKYFGVRCTLKVDGEKEREKKTCLVYRAENLLSGRQIGDCRHYK